MRRKSNGSVKNYFANRKIERGGSRGWYGFRKQEPDYAIDDPSRYSGDVREEKHLPQMKGIDLYSSKEKMAAPPPVSRRDSYRSGREGLLDNAASFEKDLVELPVTRTATETFYNVSKQNTFLARQVSDVQKNTGTQNTYLSRQPSDSNYANVGTYITRQASDAYDPNQRGPNHLSYLSSLSSGFGDGLIIPDPTVSGDQQRKSFRQSQVAPPARFSWVPSHPRDTIYTQSSVDTAPRFRTVNSWVAQQTGRVERHMQNDNEVPSMPAIPLPLQAGVATMIQIPPAPAHQRNKSSDPRLNFHPGDEVQISRGSRVPSEILDKTVGGNGLRLSRDELDS